MKHLVSERLLELSRGRAAPASDESAHLEGCSECTAALDDERRLSCCIVDALAAREPSASLAARLCCAFEEQVAARRTRARAVSWLVGALAATALMAFGVIAGASYLEPVVAHAGLMVMNTLLALHVLAVVLGSVPFAPLVATASTAVGLCGAALMLAHAARGVGAPGLVK